MSSASEQKDTFFTRCVNVNRKVRICPLTMLLVHAVIHLEIGRSEARDSHSQKSASPSDKRVSPIQHFNSFSVQNALLPLWDVRSFVTRQFLETSFQALRSKAERPGG